MNHLPIFSTVQYNHEVPHPQHFSHTHSRLRRLFHPHCTAEKKGYRPNRRCPPWCACLGYQWWRRQLWRKTEQVSPTPGCTTRWIFRRCKIRCTLLLLDSLYTCPTERLVRWPMGWLQRWHRCKWHRSSMCYKCNISRSRWSLCGSRREALYLYRAGESVCQGYRLPIKRCTCLVYELTDLSSHLNFVSSSSPIYTQFCVLPICNCVAISPCDDETKIIAWND